MPRSLATSSQVTGVSLQNRAVMNTRDKVGLSSPVASCSPALTARSTERNALGYQVGSRVRAAASRPIRDYPDTNQPPTDQRTATAVLDWCVFLWACVRVLLAGIALEWQGELFFRAIVAAGNETGARVFFGAWTAVLGVGIVLWFARQAREDARC